MALETVSVVVDKSWSLISNAAGQFDADVVAGDAILYFGATAPAAGASVGRSVRTYRNSPLADKVWARAVGDSYATLNLTRVQDAANVAAVILPDATLSATTFSTEAVAGTEIATINPQLAGAVVERISPADGRVVLSADKTKILRGLSAASAGSLEVTVYTSHPKAAGSPKGTKITLTGNTPALTITGSPPAATPGQDYRWRPVILGGGGKKTVDLSGKLPDGWTLDYANGEVFAPGYYVRSALSPVNLGTITVTSEDGQSASLSNISIAISGGVAPPYTLPTPILLDSFDTSTGNTSNIGGTVATSTAAKVQGAAAQRFANTGFGGTGGFTRTGVIPAATDPASLGVIAMYQAAEQPYLGMPGTTLSLVRGGTSYSSLKETPFGTGTKSGHMIARHVDEFVNGGVAISSLGAGAAADLKIAHDFGDPYRPGGVHSDMLIANAAGRPTFILSWDDGYVSQYTKVFQLLKARNLKGTFAPVKTRTGQAGWLNNAQIQEMIAAGMAFICDSRTDDAALGTAASVAEAMADLNSVRDWLRSLGVPESDVNHIIWTFGIFQINDAVVTSMTTTTSSAQITVGTTTGVSVGMTLQAHANAGVDGLTVQSIDDATHVTLSGTPTVASSNYRARFVTTGAPFYGSKMLDACAAAGFKTGRSVGQGTYNDFYSRYGVFGKELYLPSESLVWSDTLATKQAKIDRAVKNGTTLYIFSHDTADTTSSSTPNTVGTQNLTDILDRLASLRDQNIADVLTAPQWYARDIANPAALPF